MATGILPFRANFIFQFRRQLLLIFELRVPLFSFGDASNECFLCLFFFVLTLGELTVISQQIANLIARKAISMRIKKFLQHND